MDTCRVVIEVHNYVTQTDLEGSILYRVFKRRKSLDTFSASSSPCCSCIRAGCASCETLAECLPNRRTAVVVRISICIPLSENPMRFLNCTTSSDEKSPQSYSFVHPVSNHLLGPAPTVLGREVCDASVLAIPNPRPGKARLRSAMGMHSKRDTSLGERSALERVAVEPTIQKLKQWVVGG
ncbi:hypothetical protein PENSPDRAFT_659842 [Peniophora sp. CONT]|nr:hypothetical protein PENSPDRAFT_659842 [Peniophora sp. CONT]